MPLKHFFANLSELNANSFFSVILHGFQLRQNLWIMLMQSSPSNSVNLRPPSYSSLFLLCISNSTLLKTPKAKGTTQGSEILIKIWLSPMGYDSSGGGCNREACGLGGSAEVLSQTGPFNVVWLCPLERLVWSYKIGPNWDEAMMGPKAGTAVMREGTLNWWLLPWSTNSTHTLMDHTLPPLYYRSMAPEVGSWKCHRPLRGS